MAGAELCLRPLAEIAHLIQRREVSPVEVTRAVLDRIERLEPELNAFITVTAETAMLAARTAEAEILRGDDRGPLHGVPVSLKDLLLTRGVRTTAGSRILADHVPDQDATVVSRLREAGAVLIGKTNMLEFAYGEVHPDYGPARNPWNPEFGSSGSSSGSAVAVAAGLGYASIGSDTGGSIRLPAAYCGIVGLKPTYGLVSRRGALALAWSLDHLGPMTRTVRDCAIVLEAIAGYDAADPTSARIRVPRYRDLLAAETKRPTIGVVAPTDDDAVTPVVRSATDEAIEALKSLGFAPREISLPYPDQAVRCLVGMLYVEASSVHLPWLRSRAADYSDHTRERLELGSLMPATVYVRASRVRRLIVAAYEALLRDVDVILTPVAPFASYRLDEPMPVPVSETGDRMAPLIRFSGPFNVTGMPAVTVPCGMTPEGLPIGVQFAARPFEEAMLLQVAEAVERAMAPRVPRPAGHRFVA